MSARTPRWRRENAARLRQLYVVLLEYVAVLAAEQPLPLRRLEVLAAPLFQLAHAAPDAATAAAADLLRNLERQLVQFVEAKRTHPAARFVGARAALLYARLTGRRRRSSPARLPLRWARARRSSPRRIGMRKNCWQTIEA